MRRPTAIPTKAVRKCATGRALEWREADDGLEPHHVDDGTVCGDPLDLADLDEGALDGGTPE